MNVFKNVVQDIVATREADRREQLGQWYRLLAKLDGDEPSAADRKTLAKLMDALRKTAADAEADHALIVQTKRKASIAATVETLDAKYQDADADFLATCAECQKLWQEMNAKKAAKHQAKEQALADVTLAHQYRGEVNKLRDADPILWQAISQ